MRFAARLLTRSLATRSVRAVSGLARLNTAAPVLVRSARAPAQFQSFRLMSGGHGGFLPRDQVQERVLTLVKHFNKVDPAKVTATSHFINDLGLDSLDAVELVMAVEEEFALEIPDAEAEKIVSVKDAIDYVASHPNAH